MYTVLVAYNDQHEDSWLAEDNLEHRIKKFNSLSAVAWVRLSLCFVESFTLVLVVFPEAVAVVAPQY